MTSKIMTFASVLALCGFTASVSGCEDKQCKTELQTVWSTAESERKTIETLQLENDRLKRAAEQNGQLAARVEALLKENEALKSAPPDPPPLSTTAKRR